MIAGEHRQDNSIRFECNSLDRVRSPSRATIGRVLPLAMRRFFHISIALGVLGLSAGPRSVAWAQPGTGNSGTIKVSDQPLSSSTMANDPHPGCPFYILGFDLPASTGTYWITPQPVNGNGPAGTTTSRESPIAYADGASSPYPVVVVVQPTSRPNGSSVDLQIGPISDLASGQYKVSVDTDGTPGGAKQKFSA